MNENEQNEAPITSERNLRELRAQCESPIEILMGAALIQASGMTAVWLDDGKDRMAQFYALPSGNVAALIPQFDTWACGRRYRLDFLVITHIDSVDRSVVVECDGHDYHDRTKEQASADRARDRALQAEGVLVARFTGSDIHADAAACAREVWQMAGLFPKPKSRPGDEP